VRLVTSIEGTRAILGSCVRRQRDRRRHATGICRKLADATHQLVTIDIRQADVADDDVYRVVHVREPLCGGSRKHHLGTVSGEKALEEFAGVRFVFDHEDPNPTERIVRVHRISGSDFRWRASDGRRDAGRQHDGKRRAPSYAGAIRPDRTTM